MVRGGEEVKKKDLRDMGASWEGAKREPLNILGWRSVGCYVGLGWLCAAVSC
jgi:hypothetical protein